MGRYFEVVVETPEVRKTIESWIEDGYVTGADDKFADAAEEPEEAEDDEDDKSA